jgi:hypothetical protein
MIPQLVSLIVVILVAGVLVWAIDQLPAIDPTFKQVAKVIIIVVLAIYAIVTIAGFMGAGWAPAWR